MDPCFYVVYHYYILYIVIISGLNSSQLYSVPQQTLCLTDLTYIFYSEIQLEPVWILTAVFPLGGLRFTGYFLFLDGSL